MVGVKLFEDIEQAQTLATPPPSHRLVYMPFRVGFSVLT